MPVRRELAAAVDLEAGARVIPAGTELYRQGENCPVCFVVLSGWVALSVLLDDGSCQILDFALPGTVLGFLSSPGAPIYHSAKCLSIVRAVSFPRLTLDAMIETNPRLALLLCRQIVADEARAHDHLANVGLRGARERIAHLLLEIYIRLRRSLPNEPGEVVDLPLSQGQIGQALGLTYVHVSRTLHILREQRIVGFANHKLEIIDPRALVAAAGIDFDLPEEKPRTGERQLYQLLLASLPRAPGPSLPPRWMPVSLQQERGRRATAGSPPSTAAVGARKAA
jgi:CRP/FNR family transcriptional regulator, anaerobic regulatory protein